jgi:hypothetical protein
MTASMLAFEDHAEVIILDDSGELMLRWTAELPSRSLLNVPEQSSGRFPFNPFPRSWQGPTEPPMERG